MYRVSQLRVHSGFVADIMAHIVSYFASRILDTSDYVRQYRHDDYYRTWGQFMMCVGQAKAFDARCRVRYITYS